jgi:hypothetical protein
MEPFLSPTRWYGRCVSDLPHFRSVLGGFHGGRGAEGSRRSQELPAVCSLSTHYVISIERIALTSILGEEGKQKEVGAVVKSNGSVVVVGIMFSPKGDASAG